MHLRIQRVKDASGEEASDENEVKITYWPPCNEWQMSKCRVHGLKYIIEPYNELSISFMHQCLLSVSLLI